MKKKETMMVSSNHVTLSSDELKNKNIQDVSRLSRLSKGNYWHYTSLKAADNILQQHELQLSNLAKMNDQDEAKYHERDGPFIHCFCFCNSNSEKIPMWYLYSGIDGHGASLGFTPGSMRVLIESIDRVTVPNNDVVLYKDKGDFDISFGWVYYRQTKNQSQVFYRNNWYNLKDPENFEYNNLMIKPYSWEYEREFRIIVQNYTGTPYEKIAINIDTILSKVKLKTAPELDDNYIIDSLDDYPGIKALLNKKIQKSDLDIKMNLFSRNQPSFIEYMKSSSKEKMSKEEYDYFLKALKKFNDAMNDAT